MAKKVVKPWVGYATKAVICIAILVGLYFLAGVSGVLPKDADGKTSLFGGGSGSDDDVIVFSSNTFQGFLPWMLMNNGLEPNEDEDSDSGRF